jgi:hypothetical protein
MQAACRNGDDCAVPRATCCNQIAFNSGVPTNESRCRDDGCRISRQKLRAKCSAGPRENIAQSHKRSVGLQWGKWSGGQYGLRGRRDSVNLSEEVAAPIALELAL